MVCQVWEINALPHDYTKAEFPYVNTPTGKSTSEKLRADSFLL
jgi:hypothetical protein